MIGVAAVSYRLGKHIIKILVIKEEHVLETLYVRGNEPYRLIGVYFTSDLVE